MDLDIFERVIASSPVIVVVVIAANIALWRKLEVKDAKLEALQREVLLAMGSVTTAVADLTRALERR